MKIIVSTKWFPKVIKKALKDEFKNFVIDGVNNTIEFYDGAKYYREDITQTIDSKKEVFRSRFNQLQWYKMAEFIKQLEEQPIVIEFDYEEEPTLKLLQFIKRFD